MTSHEATINGRVKIWVFALGVLKIGTVSGLLWNDNKLDWMSNWRYGWEGQDKTNLDNK